MQHSRSLSPRLLAACAFLAVTGAGLGLPQRGAAQDDMTRRPAAPGDAAGTDPNTVGNAGAVPANSDDPGGSGDGSPGNGGDGTGEASPSPPVGVDNSGSAGALGTRTGRTNRQRLPVTPPNPLVLTSPTRGTGPGTTGRSVGNRATPLISPRAPGVYTLQTDPFQPRLGPGSRPLPLFGYDFFQPARQIIIARRRALLPRPTPAQTGTRSRSAVTQVGSGSAAGVGSVTNGSGTDGQGTNGQDASGQDVNGGASGASQGAAARRRAADAAVVGVAGGDANDPNAASTDDPNAPDTGGAGGSGQTNTNNGGDLCQ